MNTIAYLSGVSITEHENHGSGASLLVTNNPTNALNNREIQYISPNNITLGTNGTFLKIENYTDYSDVPPAVINNIRLGSSTAYINIESAQTDTILMNSVDTSIVSSNSVNLRIPESTSPYSPSLYSLSLNSNSGLEITHNNNNITMDDSGVAIQGIKDININNANSDNYPIGSIMIGYVIQLTTVATRPEMNPGETVVIGQGNFSIRIMAFDGTTISFNSVDDNITVRALSHINGSNKDIGLMMRIA